MSVDCRLCKHFNSTNGFCASLGEEIRPGYIYSGRCANYEVKVGLEAFEPGKCPSCKHEQHIGKPCGAKVERKGDAFPDICGCAPENAIKADAGKQGGFRLLAWDSILEVLGVYEYGIKKGYLADSWRKVEVSRYEDALMRHMIKHLSGEKRDPESGLRHIAHVAWNALAVMALAKGE